MRSEEERLWRKAWKRINTDGDEYVEVDELREWFFTASPLYEAMSFKEFLALMMHEVSRFCIFFFLEVSFEVVSCCVLVKSASALQLLLPLLTL
jgi:hypothetical protein